MAAENADTIPYLNASKQIKTDTAFAYDYTNDELNVGSVKERNVQTITSATTLDATYAFVGTDSTGAAFQVTLPAITTDLLYKEYRVQDIVGISASRHVTVKADAGDTLNGSLGGSAVIAINFGYVVVKAVALNQWVITDKLLT